jgi:hypothetical protein
LGSSAIGTLVERTTRFTMLLHLPRMNGHGDEPRIKNGPALAGHGAEAVRDAIAASIATLPEQLRRSLAMESTWAAIKREIRHIWGPWEQLTRSQLRTILFEYIEVFYNRQRRQAASDTAPPPRPTLPAEQRDSQRSPNV